MTFSMKVYARYLFKVSVSVFIFILLFFIARTFVLSFGIVNGDSMMPALRDKDIFIVNKIGMFFSTPKKGDIMQLVDPENKKMLVKRIVGAPGDMIIKKGRQVYLKESDLWIPLNTSIVMGQYSHNEIITLGEHEYYVLGDNSGNSRDSRDYGPIHRSGIVGKVILIHRQ